MTTPYVYLKSFMSKIEKKHRNVKKRLSKAEVTKDCQKELTSEQKILINGEPYIREQCNHLGTVVEELNVVISKAEHAEQLLTSQCIFLSRNLGLLQGMAHCLGEENFYIFCEEVFGAKLTSDFVLSPAFMIANFSLKPNERDSLYNFLSSPTASKLSKTPMQIKTQFDEWLVSKGNKLREEHEKEELALENHVLSNTEIEIETLQGEHVQDHDNGDSPLRCTPAHSLKSEVELDENDVRKCQELIDSFQRATGLNFLAPPNYDKARTVEVQFNNHDVNMDSNLQRMESKGQCRVTDWEPVIPQENSQAKVEPNKPELSAMLPDGAVSNSKVGGISQMKNGDDIFSHAADSEFLREEKARSNGFGNVKYPNNARRGNSSTSRGGRDFASGAPYRRRHVYDNRQPKSEELNSSSGGGSFRGGAYNMAKHGFAGNRSFRAGARGNSFTRDRLQNRAQQMANRGNDLVNDPKFVVSH